MNSKSIWSEIRFMLILSVICALFLGGTRMAIGERAELSDKTIGSIYDIIGEKVDQKIIYEQFAKDFKQLNKGRIKVWQKNNNSSILAYEATGSGMWAEITLVFVVDSLKKEILGLRVTEQKETPGVGGKISEEDFYAQFNAMPCHNEIKVDAVTGATTSSKSVEKLLNKALSRQLSLEKEK
ncbi:MAG: FMN-binding protein [Candidatus Riflebacteria bacterium]|nr:FMN-binding protein [Candidatus Riflebacteria bacterium]